MLNIWKKLPDGRYKFDTNVLDEEIKKLAYFKWLEAGKPENQSDKFWFLAEEETYQKVTNDL